MYGDSKHVDGFKCPARKFHAKPAINMGTFMACATRTRYLSSQEPQRHISFKWEWYMCKKIQYVASQVI